MPEYLIDIWPHIAGTLTLLITLLTSGHAILHKRDVRAVVAWIGLIWLVPILGAFLYITLGINRIKRRAKALRGFLAQYPVIPDTQPLSRANLHESLPSCAYFDALVRLMDNIVQKPLVGGNRVTQLVNGDTAYPEMLKAIDGAEHSIALSTYIFDNDEAGRLFLNALSRAVARNVEVRVLIDDVGLRYSWPRMNRELQRAGIPVARFLPSILPWRMPFMNLRNHRKILVIDGRTGFTGGMNIRAGHMIANQPRHPVLDLHFRFEGPVVAHFQETFALDWFFATREHLYGERWFPRLEPNGNVLSRGIPDGPDEDFEKLLWTIQGALACAKFSVQIVTPYFVPENSLIRSLNLAALRGVDVDILLPSKINVPGVKWASTALFWQLLERGCRIWLTPPPFDHTKLMIVDGVWILVGSANWDSRSLRLSFEFNVECYDQKLAATLNELIKKKLEGAQQVTLDEMNSRSLPVKLRDGITRLFSPYL